MTKKVEQGGCSQSDSGNTKATLGTERSCHEWGPRGDLSPGKTQGPPMAAPPMAAAVKGRQ